MIIYPNLTLPVLFFQGDFPGIAPPEKVPKMNLETELKIVKTVQVVKTKTEFETEIETEKAPIPTELSSSSAVET
jgi:hypothetical protein